MELKNFMSGVFLVIMVLTVLVSVISADYFFNLPFDMMLGWGAVVLLGLVGSIGKIISAWQGAKEK